MWGRPKIFVLVPDSNIKGGYIIIIFRKNDKFVWLNLFMAIDYS